MKPKIVIMADVPNWAWGRKAEHLKRWLSDDFDVTVWYLKYGGVPEIFDLYHTFDFPNVTWVPEGKLCVTGCTAHVWPTWGGEKIRIWAKRASAIHANSRLLEADMLGLELNRPVFYVPNGVCPDQFRRTRPRPKGSTLIVGHQGKPNPRKGADILQAAVEVARERGADIDFRLLQRTSKDAISVEGMLDWYQDLDLLMFASDMDGTPNPMLEGAACGVPSVINSIGNAPEFIRHNFNGRLVAGLGPFDLARGPQPDGFVAHGNRAALIERYVARLMQAVRDRGRVIEMGAAARVTVLTAWTWEKQAEHYRTMWSSVLEGAA